MLRVRACGTLGDLSDNKPAKVKEERPTKECSYCKKLWSPVSGMASKVRVYCYGPSCEQQHEMERLAQRRQQYANGLAVSSRYRR